ncbi:MAG TPA: hypothetical protein PLV65_10810 [Tenuifilaceae bacterium]|nr:hypothetical protein [Tenuifilaceae bacterium]
MKSTKLFFISTLVALAFILGSCGATAEKNNAEEAKVECNDELKKEHDCAHAKTDTCETEKAKEHDCDHEHEAEAQEEKAADCDSK